MSVPQEANADWNAGNIVMPDKIRNYAELRELIRVSLRIQHPEWVNSDGNSPICDFYDARLSELLGLVPSQQDEPELRVGDRAEEAKNNPSDTEVFGSFSTCSLMTSLWSGKRLPATLQRLSR